MIYISEDFDNLSSSSSKTLFQLGLKSSVSALVSSRNKNSEKYRYH